MIIAKFQHTANGDWAILVRDKSDSAEIRKFHIAANEHYYEAKDGIDIAHRYSTVAVFTRLQFEEVSRKTTFKQFRELVDHKIEQYEKTEGAVGYQYEYNDCHDFALRLWHLMTQQDVRQYFYKQLNALNAMYHNTRQWPTN